MTTGFGARVTIMLPCFGATLRFLVMMAVTKHHPLRQGNCKNAFGQGVLPDNKNYHCPASIRGSWSGTKWVLASPPHSIWSLLEPLLLVWKNSQDSYLHWPHSISQRSVPLHRICPQSQQSQRPSLRASPLTWIVRRQLCLLLQRSRSWRNILPPFWWTLQSWFYGHPGVVLWGSFLVAHLLIGCFGSRESIGLHLQPRWKLLLWDT